MSTRIATVSLVIISALSGVPVALAQVQQHPGVYQARLSGWCQSIDANERISAHLGDFRVRKGGYLAASGSRHAIFVEKGGVIELTGTASVVYVAKGGKATISGDKHQIYSETGASVAILGKANVAMVGALALSLNKNAADCL
jgi:hypothetical protein